MSGTPVSVATTTQLHNMMECLRTDNPEAQQLCYQAIATEHGTLDSRLRPVGAPVHRMLLNLRLKFHADGSYDKCKARAVVMGNGMCYQRDHGLTHAPTARETTVRTELCRALHKSYHRKVFDISQAFTHGRPDRHVHLEFPAGMQQECGKDGDRKCKYLNFSLYMAHPADRDAGT
jgi:hypothetical protein